MARTPDYYAILVGLTPPNRTLPYLMAPPPDYSVLLPASGDPPNELAIIKIYGRDVAGVTQLFAIASDGTVTQLTPAPAPGGGGGELQWGVHDISGSPTVRALPRGWDPGTAELIPGSGISIYDFAAPRAGVLRNLFVRHNTAGAGAVIATYTIAINGVATALAASLSCGPIGQASNLVNIVAVAQGARIRLQVTKAAPISNSDIDVQATVEFA